MAHNKGSAVDDPVRLRLLVADSTTRYVIASARPAERQRCLQLLQDAHRVCGRTCAPPVDPNWSLPDALSVALAKCLWPLASFIRETEQTGALMDEWSFFEILAGRSGAGDLHAPHPHANLCVSRILQRVALRAPLVVTILLRRPQQGRSHAAIARQLLNYRDTFLLPGTHWIFVGAPHTVRQTLLSYSQLRSIVSGVAFPFP